MYETRQDYAAYSVMPHQQLDQEETLQLLKQDRNRSTLVLSLSEGSYSMLHPNGS